MRIQFPNGSVGGLITRLHTTGFSLLFFAVGALFFWALGKEAARDLDARRWKATEARILESAIEFRGESDAALAALRARYAYKAEGRVFESEQVTFNYNGSSNYAETQRLLREYPAGSISVCYVNPDDPSQAILRRPALWAVPFLLLPMSFMAIGLGGLVLSWAGIGRAKAESRPRPMTAQRAGGRGFAVAFFALFLAVGLLVFHFIMIRPVMKIRAAREWPAIPCVVQSSHVRSHNSDDSTTYSVDIAFTYEFEGVDYISNQYSFFGGSSSGYEGKRRVVDAHPPGLRTVCYVNPADPTDAVLARGFLPEAWFGLLPLVFVIVGGGGIIWMLRDGRNSAAGFRLSPGPHAGPVELKSHQSPLNRLVLILLVAAFWNGIVSVFAVEAWQGWANGRPSIFMTLFLTPFLLVGLVLLGMAGHAFLGLFNPRVRLILASASLAPGESADLDWRFAGRTRAIREFRIFLEGREEAVYQRGRETVTDEKVFHAAELASASDPKTMSRGKAIVEIPGDALHSFESPDKKIIWALKVTGRIERWPDIDEEFRLQVGDVDVRSDRKG